LPGLGAFGGKFWGSATPKFRYLVQENKMGFSAKQYRETVKIYNDRVRKWDQVLYRMCDEWPGHSDLGAIIAKVGIIGRSYAAQAERFVKKNDEDDYGVWILSELLHSRTDVSKAFKRIASIKEPLSAEKLATLMEVHKDLCGILSERTRNGAYVRSFVSKYMHFHQRCTPVYDNIAVERLRKPAFYRWTSSLEAVEFEDDRYDEYYWYYCMRFWALYKDAQRAGVEFNVKLLDNYIMNYPEALLKIPVK
jgi:hypothetical protein